MGIFSTNKPKDVIDGAILNILESNTKHKYRKIADKVTSNITNVIKKGEGFVKEDTRALLDVALVNAVAIAHFDKENRTSWWWGFFWWVTGIASSVLCAMYIEPVKQLIEKYIIGV